MCASQSPFRAASHAIRLCCCHIYTLAMRSFSFLSFFILKLECCSSRRSHSYRFQDGPLNHGQLFLQRIIIIIKVQCCSSRRLGCRAGPLVTMRVSLVSTRQCRIGLSVSVFLLFIACHAVCSSISSSFRIGLVGLNPFGRDKTSVTRLGTWS